MNTLKTLALLIDGDNAQPKYLKQIIQFCENYGTLKIKNAYGDWKQPPLAAHCKVVKELTIERVQQDRVGKNATDFGLAMDVGSMLDKGEVDIYFIVSSDGDFTAMCERIRQKGAQVIGIGSKSSSSSTLRKSCNTFFYAEDIVEKQNKPSTKSSTAPKPKITPILEILIQAYQKTPQENGWVHLGQLGEVLRHHDKQFYQRFANKKLSTWFKDFPQKFEVLGHRVRIR